METNEILRPLKAIREQCKECCGNKTDEIKACSGLSCSLWYYRFGKRPIVDSRMKNPLLAAHLFEKVKGMKAKEAIETVTKLWNEEKLAKNGDKR